MIIVSDTSPISNLLKIGEIELLRLVFSNVLIPNSVYREICKVDGNRLAIAELDWIVPVEVSNVSLRDRLLETVDSGEAEAIALAVELSADYLLIDEALGRSVAREMGLKITGILGLLLRAKSDGHIDAIAPYIDRLISEANFRLSSDLIQATLFQAGEI